MDTDDLQLMHLREWVSYLQGSPLLCGEGTLSDRSVYYYSNVVLVFCRWLEHESVIEKPITTRFKLPRVEQKFIPTFTPDDVEKLLGLFVTLRAAGTQDASQFAQRVAPPVTGGPKWLLLRLERTKRAALSSPLSNITGICNGRDKGSCRFSTRFSLHAK